MNTIKENMNFRDYYNSLSRLPGDLKKKICEKLEISDKTFYNKMNDNTFDYPQKLVISMILEKPIDELFPPTPNNQAV